MVIDAKHIPVLEEILWEFIGSKPDTIKVPSRKVEGTYIRICTTFNPEWYRDMCKDFPRGIDKHNRKGPNKKKPRTIVKREHTIDVIESMIKNLSSQSKYAPYVMDEVERRSPCHAVEWNGQF